MARTSPPVSSFGPELQRALRAGVQRETKIEFSTENLAIRFVHRLNALRKALRVEKHPDAEHLYRCGIHRDKGSSIVKLMPRDSEFAEAVSSFGAEIIATGVALPEEETPSALENFLSEAAEIPPEGENKG